MEKGEESFWRRWPEFRRYTQIMEFSWWIKLIFSTYWFQSDGATSPHWGTKAALL